MSSELIAFGSLSVEALTEVAKEKFEEAVWAIEKALTKQLEFGRVMLIVKSKLPYGEWGKWVRETFQDQMSLRNIQFHMKAHQEVAKNPSLLECANSLDDILTATAKSKKPSVEVVEPEPTQVKGQKPDIEPGEKATVAVSREETRKAPAHRPPAKFTEVSPSYDDADSEDKPDDEPEFDVTAATSRLCSRARSMIEAEVSRWPADMRPVCLDLFSGVVEEFK